ncbi:MAG TPA: hypothetical protein VGP10_02885, partial [Marisediminicola sp.]|nr:hypothetical protein [Marisediminicola sp.]
MLRFRDCSSHVAHVRHAMLVIGVVLAAGCGGDATAPGKVLDPVVPDPMVPDRMEIVYALHARGQFDSLDLYVTDPDGSSSRPLLSMAGEESFPSWSPDGRTVLFQHRENGVLSLWRAKEDGSGATQIPATTVGYPRWSADGSWIIFPALVVTGTAEVAAVHPDGTGRHSLTTGISGVMLSPAAWSTTSRLAFMRAAGSGGKGNIWAMNLDGTGLTQITTGDQDQTPLWSPDGSLMAYTFFTLPPPGASEVTAQVIVVNANGSGPRVVTGLDGSRSNILVSWSPDGQWLLYQH